MDEIFILNKENIRQIQNTNHCYIIAKNGIFHKQNQKYFESITPVDDIPVLDTSIKTVINWRYPKINEHQMLTILKFFQDVNKKYHAECMVFIGFDRKEKKIVIFPPSQQTVSSASIRYKNDPTPGISIIGTIHSHNTMGAFHSATDIQDEMDFDGLHITFGKLSNDNDSFQISCQLVSNKIRQDINYDSVIEGLKRYNSQKTFKTNIVQSLLKFTHMFKTIKVTDVKSDNNMVCPVKCTSDLSDEHLKMIDNWFKTINTYNYNSYNKSFLTSHNNNVQNHTFNQYDVFNGYDIIDGDINDILDYSGDLVDYSDDFFINDLV